MTPDEFISIMSRAESLRAGASPEAQVYWRGFILGLRRGYHGDDFGGAEQHDRWLKAAFSDAPDKHHGGCGYLDGLYRATRWDVAPGPEILREYLRAHRLTQAEAAKRCGNDARAMRFWLASETAKHHRQISLACWRLLLTHAWWGE